MTSWSPSSRSMARLRVLAIDYLVRDDASGDGCERRPFPAPAIIDCCQMMSSRSVAAGRPPPVKVTGQPQCEGHLDSFLPLAHEVGPIKEMGRSGTGAAGRCGAGPGLPVPPD